MLSPERRWHKLELKVLEHIRLVLESFDDKYLNHGRLKRTKIIEDLDAYNSQLIERLLSDDLIHNTYTKKIAGVKIFEMNQFIQMLEFKEYWEDSYTKYSNKIGLTSGGKFIDDSEDVVLDFPFKDSVLKAGMTKEDVEKEESVNESFLNEVIAKPEIDELLEPKVLVNARRYDANGESSITNINDKDNLIIKGNNLVALHSLKERYAGKIKSIILDEPYFFNKKKRSDSFEYNSNFKLSTWLTFMKNRLKVAYDLLSNDGILILITGIDGAPYLRLLANDVFHVLSKNKCFIGEIAWRKTDNQSNIGDFSNVSDRIILYRKNPQTSLERLPLSEKAKREYSYEDAKGKYRRSNILDKTRGKYFYTITTPDGSKIEGPWMIDEAEYDNLKDNNGIHWPKSGKQIPYGKTYLKDQIAKGQISSDFWDKNYGTNQRGAAEMKALFGERVFSFPKPEKLLQNLISISSKEGDIVLDFFMGSGTTQAVAMKMNRQFIGIEQMDYINTVSVPRLKKVISGEQGGISKDVNWQGGGSFIYVELMEKNDGFVRDVKGAKSLEELKIVFDRMKGTADFDFRVDLDKFEVELGNFNSLADQKRELLRILDKNRLYYLYSNIDDDNVHNLISDSDYQFNQSFYGNGDENNG